LAVSVCDELVPPPLLVCDPPPILLATSLFLR